ncbi:MAG: GDP-mannose 4,6-dehydratase [Candidatus Omnitrophota bacterium]|jgi:CDP-glucose 4,6-dehydratase
MNKHFWKGRRVLITGFEGFLGSNLTKALLCSGAKIYGLDIKVRRKDTILAAADYKKITVIKGSVADYKLVESIMRRNRINVVFHLAAEAIVGKCHSSPLCTFSTNIKGTWDILEACRNSNNIQAVIIASSDKAYGSHKKLPYVEKTPLQGNHPYDVSKSCADLIANTYAYTYGLPVCVTRCGNIFGPGDFNFSRLVPEAVICALIRKKLLIRSDGLFTRDYVFVEDVVNGYILLAEKICKLNLSGECFNFSCEKPLTVIKLVKMISKAVGKPTDYKILNQAKYEIRHQYLSSRKARAKLGWRPAFSLDTGLKNTIDWYKKVF